jgi:hypothetical protein
MFHNRNLSKHKKESNEGKESQKGNKNIGSKEQIGKIVSFPTDNDYK